MASQKSIKKNFVYNIMNVVTKMLFPLVTFPYASRILLADGIGLIDFYNSIIQYVILISSLGIPLYAIRESARVRNEEKQLSKTSLEIIILHAGLTFIGYFAVFILSCSVDRIAENVTLFLLLSAAIFLNTIGCEWLFKGVEDFKYITIRSLIVKAISVALLYICVQSREDLLWYAFLMVLSSFGGNVFNLFRMKTYIKKSTISLKDLHPLEHLQPCLKIFALNLIISIYCNLDIVMLGFMSGSTQVGYYVAAHKIELILQSIVTALGTVILPRLSNLIAEGKYDEFKKLSQKSVDFILMLSMPMTLGIIAIADSVINVFCGGSYEPSIITLQILAPLTLIIGLSNAIGIQILYPQGKENLVMISTGAGAAINLSLNLLLIPKYSCHGAAISTLIAEIVVTIVMITIGRRYLAFNLLQLYNAWIIASSIIMFIVCLLLSRCLEDDTIILLLIPFTACCVYGLCLYAAKHPLVIDFLTSLKTKGKDAINNRTK